MEKPVQTTLLRLAALQEEQGRASRPKANHPDFELEVKVGSFRLLAELVGTSYRLGGTLGSQVWRTICACCSRECAYSYDPEEEEVLEDLRESDCSPLNELAAEVFTHIGLAFGIPEGFYHPSPIVNEEDASRKANLILRILKRDGTCCPMTGATFYGTTSDDLGRNEPVLTHIIPSSVFTKPESLQYLRILSGLDTQKLIEDLADIATQTEDPDNIIANLLTLPLPVAQAYQHGHIGIQHTDLSSDLMFASDDIRDDDVPYNLRLIVPELIPSELHLHDGSPIHFGRGLSDPSSSPVDERFHGRLDLPHPLLCNLRYELACALQESGVRELIAKLMAEANQPLESPTEETVNIPHPQPIRIRRRTLSFLGAEATSERVIRIVGGRRKRSLTLGAGSDQEEMKKDGREQFCEVLSAKLMICGRAAVIL